MSVTQLVENTDSKYNYNITPLTVHEALNHPKLTGALLVETLAFDLELKKYFLMNAGVSEGYTVGEHTIRVLNVAIEHRMALELMLPHPITWQDFLFFLSLHDIGKGEAALCNNNNNAVNFKRDELENTRKILRKVMQNHQMAPEKIEMFCQLLYKDSQGLYLRDFTPEHELFSDVVIFSHRCGLSPQAYYSLLTAYHLADAASYPALGSLFDWEPVLQHGSANTKKISLMEERLQSAIEGKKIYEELEKELMTGKGGDQNKIRDLLLKNPKNYDYVQQIHILHRQNPIQFGDTAHRIRYLTEFAFSRVMPTNQFAQAYEDLLQHGPKNELRSRRNPVEKIAEMLGFPEREDISIFIDAIIHLRQSLYTLEISHKVDSITKKTLTSSFWHGTNSGMLFGLKKTRSILPLGFLRRLNILPLSGECTRGTEGVSRRNVSGVALEAISTAVTRYAANEDWHIDLDQIEKVGKNLIECWEKGQFWFYKKTSEKEEINLYFRAEIRFPLELERYKAFFPESFSQYKLTFTEIVNTLKTEIETYEHSSLYQEYLPKNLGGTYHDEYYYSHYEIGKGIIEKLVKCMNSTSTDNLDANFIKDPYPIIWGSTTLTPTISSSFNAAERLVGVAKIGDDYNLAATEQEHVKKLTTYLGTMGLKEKVTVIAFDQINEALKHYSALSRKIHDFAGWEK